MKKCIGDQVAIKDSKDKWANLETSVLLPLVEEYDGLVIVATNLEHNLDPAMTRRFQQKIKFPFPAYPERLKIWEMGLPPTFSYANPAAGLKLAQYKLSQAAIINVLKGGCIQAKKRGSNTVMGQDLDHGIRLEFAKSGLTPSWDNLPGGN